MRLLIPLMLLPFITFSQVLLWSENADGTWFNSKYAKLQAAASYSITASTAQAYSGKKSIRFELRATDKEVQDGTRAEITFPISTSTNRWYSYALYVPSKEYKTDKSDEVITQWHQGNGKTPALCLRTKNDRLYLRVLGEWVDLGTLQKDSWHTYVMHIIHKADKGGLVQIWRDNVEILNRPGPNSYPLTGGFHLPFWKFGVYKAAWNGSATTGSTKRVLYFDDVKMGSDSATYSMMAP